MLNLLLLILIQAIAFLIILWLVLGWMHRRGIKRKGFPPSKQNLSVVQERELHLSLPYEQAFAVCKEAIERLSQITLKQVDYSTGRLVANRQMTWESFGEKIVMNIQAINDDATQVEFASRPIVPTTIFDYGKNLQNVERIRQYLISYAV